MNQYLGALGELVMWLRWSSLAVPLAALPVLVAVWFATRRAVRRPRSSRSLAIVRVWAGMLALSCVILLATQALALLDPTDGPRLLWNALEALVVAVLVPPMHALRTTLLRFVGRPGDGGGPGAEWLRRVSWVLFAALALLWLHVAAMVARFPFGGGEFHAMFAYTQEGRIDVAHLAWRWSVGILGITAVVFAVWIPLRWWVTALLACAVGMWHWWHVVTWEYPVSARFHQHAVALFVALPVTVLLIAAAGVGIRHVVARRRGVARTSGAG
jgi:hypothetical protein